MDPTTKVPPSATGAQERIRVQKIGGGVVLSGSITHYYFDSGSFEALLDIQRPGENAILFESSPGSLEFIDSVYGQTWRLVQ